MISEFDDIKNSIKEIALNGETLHSMLCFVQKVDEAKLICSVFTSDGIYVYENVRLKEITDTTKKEYGTYLIPAKDSRVIIDFIGNGQPYITMVSEVDKVITVIKDVKYELSEKGEVLNVKKIALTVNEKGLELKGDSDIRLAVTSKGLSLENKTESKDLKKTLDALLDFLAKEYMVQTAWGPSGPAMPDAASKIDEFKADLATILMEGGDNATS